MSNLQLRIISALVMIPFVFGAIILGGWFFAIFTALMFALAGYEWIKLSLQTQTKTAFLLAGIIYLPLSFYTFYYLRTGFADGLYLILTMLILIWSADTGAYFIGRKFGKHKMSPTISPNKSWEGLIGAMFFSVLALILIMEFVLSADANPGILKLALVGATVGYVGQIGDLLESFLKRKANAKDSSSLIPGHGGVLDRIDGLLTAVPCFAFFLLLTL